jgi:hypothetical protein
MLAPISGELIALMFLPVKQTEIADKKFMTGQARRDFPAQVSFDFATFRFDTLNFFLVSQRLYSLLNPECLLKCANTQRG